MPSEIHFQTASLYLILIRQESFNLIGSDGPRLFTTTSNKFATLLIRQFVAHLNSIYNLTIQVFIFKHFSFLKHTLPTLGETSCLI